MYPAQTSFIPVQVALARFLESQGWRAIFSHYPYWYLGTTLFRYLTGPILPSLLVVGHKLLPGLSLFKIFWGWLGIFGIFGIFGVYLLVRELGSRGVALLAAIFYGFGPIVLSLFRFSSGLDLIAFFLLPYTLLLYTKFLEKRTRKLTFLCILSISLLMLLNTAILPQLILGVMAIFLTVTGWKKAEEKLKSSIVLFLFSFLAATFWYSPGYWWQIIFAPSFAGKPLFRVVSELAQLLPISLAIGLAVVSSKIVKSKDRVLKFCFYWLFIFGFLTSMRFISDPDFWLDWMTYGTELQMGIGIAIGLIVQSSKSKVQSCSSKFKVFSYSFLVAGLIFYFLLFTLCFKKYVLGTLQKDITQSVEYRIGRFLSETVKPEEKVFLSGSSVFWLNAFFDIAQVRGGVDQAAVHPTWDKMAWEIREGKDIRKSIKWLDELGVDYLVVHTSESEEFYHDFVYPEKFENSPRLEKIYDDQGDRIYRRL